MSDARVCLRFGLAVICLVGGGCQGSSEPPLPADETVDELKTSGWSFVGSEQVRGGKTEHWLRLERIPRGTNVDLYVTTDKPPSQQFVESLKLNVWSEAKTNRATIDKAVSIAIMRLSKVVPEAGGLVESARQSKRQEMNEAIPTPVRWVGRSGSRSGWKAEVIEYTDHPPGDTPRQQFSLMLRYDR